MSEVPPTPTRQERDAAQHALARRVLRQRLVALVVAAATLAAVTILSANGAAPPTLVSAVGSGPGHLALGSASASPRNILVADRGNNRLVVISPLGQLAWTMAIAKPTDAYLSPTHHSVVVSQQSVQAVLKLGAIDEKLDFFYGKVDQPGAGDNHLRDPRTAQQLKSGELLIADQGNCRVVFLSPPKPHPVNVLGSSSRCRHDPPRSFSFPNAAFPTAARGLVITESRPGWIDLLSPTDRLISSFRPQGMALPYDASEFAPGRLIATNHTYPGAVEEFTTSGRPLWRYGPTSGPGELNKPTLARVLPGGNVLVCDSANDRIVVISRATKRIIWQYGHTGHAGSEPGYLDAPASAMPLPPAKSH